MARIAGVELEDKLKVDYALTKIKGIGWALSIKILDSLKIDSSKRVSDLTSDDISKIVSKMDKYPIEGDLMRKVREDIARLRATGSYKGMRHARGLPARGQRTKTNARTKRGKRKTVGAFKKDVLSKVAQSKQGEGS
ncbi:30S ribosomal protein S13 [Candidatus Woesebacteria bacterium]|nr:MAG: 30S ribosomal protein S13 [Candidatus Woesebacteria bacterium]